MKKLSRRDFLKSAIACSCGVSAWGAFPWLSIEKAFAETENDTKLLIIKMNGG